MAGEIAAIAMKKAPVNGLGAELCSGIAEARDRPNAGVAVKAIVLAGMPRVCSAGTDVTEFGTPKALRGPNRQRGRAHPRGGHRRARLRH